MDHEYTLIFYIQGLLVTESWCTHFDMNNVDMAKHKQGYIQVATETTDAILCNHMLLCTMNCLRGSFFLTLLVCCCINTITVTLMNVIGGGVREPAVGN